ncbi:G-protein coupled receptor 4-like [Pristis pectinata]|uniref:G-protein coupled receptor 4-like n=1 Tax=Pristis pectinata TaxID=685728 RepID=UPI00223CCEC4|nr:G-protein coupled receptor 4-like [Pristis pectinata]
MTDNLTREVSNSNCTVDTHVESALVPILLAASFFVSLPGNLLSIYVACCHVKRGYEIGIYLLNLCFVDILYTLTLPYWFIAYFSPITNMPLYNALVVVTYSSMYLSPAFLCCIAVDRYLAIVYPLWFYELRTIRVAVVVSAVCWLAELTCHALLLHQQALFSNFSSTVYVERFPMKTTMVAEYVTRSVVGFCLPLSIFLFSSHHIYRAVAESSTVENREKKKLAKLLLLLLLVYAISFGPYHATILVRSLVEPGNCPFAQNVYTFYKVFYALTGLNCAADPILYCWLYDRAWQDIVQLRMTARDQLLRLCGWLKRWIDRPKKLSTVLPPQGCTTIKIT